MNQPSGPEWLEFVYLPSYDRSRSTAIADEVEQAFERIILANPFVGAVVAGTGGVRKVRVALPGRGKRGGARFLYFFRVRTERVYVVSVYAKNDRGSISQQDKDVMRQIVKTVEALE